MNGTHQLSIKVKSTLLFEKLEIALLGQIRHWQVRKATMYSKRTRADNVNAATEDARRRNMIVSLNS
jgi:hypothetical protein